VHVAFLPFSLSLSLSLSLSFSLFLPFVHVAFARILPRSYLRGQTERRHGERSVSKPLPVKSLLNLRCLPRCVNRQWTRSRDLSPSSIMRHKVRDTVSKFFPRSPMLRRTAKSLSLFLSVNDCDQSRLRYPKYRDHLTL